MKLTNAYELSKEEQEARDIESHQKSVAPKDYDDLEGGIYTITDAYWNGQWYTVAENSENPDDYTLLCKAKNCDCAWKHAEKLIDNGFEL